MIDNLRQDLDALRRRALAYTLAGWPTPALLDAEDLGVEAELARLEGRPIGNQVGA